MFAYQVCWCWTYICDGLYVTIHWGDVIYFEGLVWYAWQKVLKSTKVLHFYALWINKRYITIFSFAQTEWKVSFFWLISDLKVLETSLTRKYYKKQTNIPTWNTRNTSHKKCKINFRMVWQCFILISKHPIT